VSRWRTYGPESFISFNYGSFELLTDRIDNGPELRIYRGKNHLGGLFSGDFKQTVAENIEGAVRLFSKMFAPYPYDHLSATEIPGGHGQGFPQLLHLAWVSFQTEQKGETDAFRAHEVAHQWFGHMVGWKTYHDQWLSEGFADYAGALYLQARYPGNVEFLRELEEWRDEILQRGGGAFWHDGPDVAPIWLGFRCSSYRSPASYHYLVYAKGAYVLHMLRQMLHDYTRGNDDRFFAMMQDFVTRFSGTDASTEDFRRVVQSHVHQDMGWFFDQWVYGTQIPRFEYQWDRTQLPDKQWVVSGRIRQFDTSPPFRAFMPITVQSADGDWTFLQEINGSATEFTTIPFRTKPEGVRFNDFHSILCREKVVRKP
jgi:aminopeptidase N